MEFALKVSNEALEPFKTSKDLNWVTMFQPIPRIITDHSLERGGNVLGLDRTQGNLVCEWSARLVRSSSSRFHHPNSRIVFQLFQSWSDATPEAALQAAAQSVISKIDQYARSIGAGNDFIYLNYARQDQNPLLSYGAANLQKLQAASKKYDPAQVFQRLVPGGYKIAQAGSGRY